MELLLSWHGIAQSAISQKVTMQKKKNGKSSWIVRKIHLCTINGQMRTHESSTISRLKEGPAGSH
jgi:hypothetical protein